MPHRRPLAIVLVASIVSLAIGIVATPFWDEDEPRFAAIARAMVDTGDWVVPMFNDELAVDKPVLMHWAMALAFTLFGTSEIAARLPAALATLFTALALLRAGTRWFDPTTGVVAALAYVGCLLVGIESHAATPDAILTALVTWATVLCAEPLLTAGGAAAPATGAALPRLTALRAATVGGLLGLAVLCKGPIGFVGPLAVVVPWTWWVAVERRLATGNVGRKPGADAPRAFLGRLLPAAFPAAWDAARILRPGILTAAMLAVAGPWYLAVSLRTDGAWINGFFFIHNVGRFVAPMEQHSGGLLFHPLTMLVGFYPWSCFLPLALVVSAWRIWQRTDAPVRRQSLALAVFWMAVWVGGFSVSATKLPNYVLPAYPAAALVVAAAGVCAAQRAWSHPRWMTAGVVWVALGGIITAAAVLVATRFGLTGAEPAALVGLVPIIGAACLWHWRREPLRAIAALAVTGLAFTGLAVGPAAAWISSANQLPGLVEAAHRHAGGHARLGTFTQITPNVVYYAHGHVQSWQRTDTAAALEFLASGADAVLLVRDDDFDALSAGLPDGVGIIGRSRPLFHAREFLLVGTASRTADRTASLGSKTQ